MTDPVAPAWHALRRSAASVGVAIRLVADAATPWWSATFAGHRLTLTVAATSDAALDAWLAALPELDLPIAHGIVADCVVDRVETIADEADATISLLILEDL